MRFRGSYAEVNLLILTAGVLAALALGLWRNWVSALSLAIGVITTIAYLKLITRQVKRLRESTTNQAKQAAIKGVFFRYLLVMIVLVLSAQFSWINIYWVMGGLLLIPLSSFLSLATMKRDE